MIKLGWSSLTSPTLWGFPSIEGISKEASYATGVDCSGNELRRHVAVEAFHQEDLPRSSTSSKQIVRSKVCREQGRRYDKLGNRGFCRVVSSLSRGGSAEGCICCRLGAVDRRGIDTSAARQQ